MPFIYCDNGCGDRTWVVTLRRDGQATSRELPCAECGEFVRYSDVTEPWPASDHDEVRHDAQLARIRELGQVSLRVRDDLPRAS
jgi:hypothetical protein